MHGFDTIATQFYNAGLKYTTAVQPYALRLFFALLVLEFLLSWIQFTAEGQLDPSYFIGRLFKQILSTGFVYLMIVNGFAWMTLVLSSFSRIGSALTGLPSLSPQTVLQIGGQMSGTIFNAPANASLMTSLELAIVQSVSAFVVLIAFVVTASVLLLTLVEAYLVIAGGIILLGFGANRFTAHAAEGYFGYVIRVGVRLLFFYLVLAVGVQMADDWSSALAAACKPVAATLPWWTTYGAPPGSIVTTVCSGSLPVSDMLDYAALAIVFMIVSIAVPHMAASIAGGTAGLALSHAVEAAVISRTVVRPITSALQNGFNKVSQIGSGKTDGRTEGRNWVNAMDFGHRAQQISNLGPDQGPRVPAPKDVGPTTRLNSTATRGVGAAPTTGMGKSTRKV